MYFGVDYYPEHWPKDWMDSDLASIQALGANTIRIGEFAWHLMEHVEGQYDFTFFDQVIEKAKAHQLKVIFGTPTATFPAWLAKKHPEILAQDAFGHIRAFGGRRLYCYNSDIYKAYSKAIVEALVSHYATEPDLVVWQIDNEFGHEGSDDCYCPVCHSKWHQFLEEKYQTIHRLNEAYGTIFWGQTYNDFSEIPMPTPTITTHNPSLKLDWARFRSVSLNQYAKAQIDTVKALKGEHQQITHNLFGGFFDRKYDQNPLAENLDVVSYDNYPVWGGLREPLEPGHIAMTLDYNYGLKQAPYWIMEQLMGAQGHDVIGYRPRPGQGRLWSWQAMARGCESLLYFRDRTMNKGQEQYCQGLIDADNTKGEKYEEAKRFFKEATEWLPRFKRPEKPKVAVVYDYDNIRSWHEQPQSECFNFTDELLRLYLPFHDLNIAVDVIDLSKSIEDYKIVLLPVQQIMDSTLSQRLEAYVAGGGILVASYRLGIKDRDNNLKLGDVVPGGLSHVLGIEVAGYESLHSDYIVNIKAASGTQGKCSVWRDLVKVTTAEPLAYYEDTFFNHYAAHTKHLYKQGRADYIAGGLDRDYLRDFIQKELVVAAELKLVITPKGVESIRREGVNGECYELLLNHNAEAVSYTDVMLEPFEVKIRSIPR